MVYHLYISANSKTFFLEILQTYSPLVERLGLDENFVDVTSAVDELYNGTSSAQIKGHMYPEDTSIENTPEEGFSSNDLGLSNCCCGISERLALASIIANQMRTSLLETLGNILFITC